MRFLKESYQKTKPHHKNFLLLILTSLLTPLFAFGIYSIFPVKVNASFTEQLQSLDTPFSVIVWGGLNTNSIQVESNPPIPLSIKVHKTNFFLKNVVEFVPNDLLPPNTTYTLEFTVENWYGFKSKKTITRTTGNIPKVVVASLAVGQKDVSSTSSISFELDQSLTKGDLTFTLVPETPVSLTRQNKTIIVKPKKAFLQGQKYTYSLDLRSSQFDDLNLFRDEFSTLSPLELTAVEPKNQAENVLKQQNLKFSFNKVLDKTTFEKGFALTPASPGTFEWVDQTTVTFKPGAVLATSTKYSITLGEQIQALDKSHLNSNQIISFTTAGAVKVSSFSPTGAYFPTNSAIKITFDQPVDQASAQSHFSISPNTSGNFSWSANTLIFQPTSLNMLTKYQVNLSAGIKTLGGEDSIQNFTASFTTTSERSTIIGYSARGRALKAYYFGTGAKKLLLIGALHGNESNTSVMLNQWVSYLRSNQSSISSDRTFVIVPATNPDGAAANNRFNANGVDLNRNWDLPDWQALTYWGNNSYPNGGGSAPFSEPETRSLRDLVARENPGLIVTYHSAANLVIGGGASNSFASWYSGLTGYGLSTNSGEEETGCQSAVGYCVTGTMEEWSGKHGNPTIVVEFSSMANPEYNKNLPALKGLLTY